MITITDVMDGAGFINMQRVLTDKNTININEQEFLNYIESIKDNLNTNLLIDIFEIAIFNRNFEVCKKLIREYPETLRLYQGYFFIKPLIPNLYTLEYTDKYLCKDEMNSKNLTLIMNLYNNKFNLSDVDLIDEGYDIVFRRIAIKLGREDVIELLMKRFPVTSENIGSFDIYEIVNSDCLARIIINEDLDLKSTYIYNIIKHRGIDYYISRVSRNCIWNVCLSAIFDEYLIDGNKMIAFNRLSKLENMNLSLVGKCYSILDGAINTFDEIADVGDLSFDETFRLLVRNGWKLSDYKLIEHVYWQVSTAFVKEGLFDEAFKIGRYFDEYISSCNLCKIENKEYAYDYARKVLEEISLDDYSTCCNYLIFLEDTNLIDEYLERGLSLSDLLKSAIHEINEKIFTHLISKNNIGSIDWEFRRNLFSESGKHLLKLIMNNEIVSEEPSDISCEKFMNLVKYGSTELVEYYISMDKYYNLLQPDAIYVLLYYNHAKPALMLIEKREDDISKYSDIIGRVCNRAALNDLISHLDIKDCDKPNFAKNLIVRGYWDIVYIVFMKYPDYYKKNIPTEIYNLVDTLTNEQNHYIMLCYRYLEIEMSKCINNMWDSENKSVGNRYLV